ncbi:MAG: hypothetical protein ACYCQJ_05620 [Nitrososphaerales archaeon]
MNGENQITKAVLFKYGADPNDPLLRDDRGEWSWCGLRDPDFWMNKVPVWAVCGPYVRKNLHPGDMVFFIPQLSRIRKAHLGHTDYIISGVLVVSDLIGDSKAVVKDKRLTDTYRRYYMKDLKGHLEKVDKGNRTSRIRGSNFVVGAATNETSFRSEWFGRKGSIAKEIVKKYGLTDHDLHKMRIPYIVGKEKVLSLYHEVIETSC